MAESQKITTGEDDLTSRSRRLAQLGALASATAVGFAPAAVAADAPAGNGFLVGGTPITLSTASGQGTAVDRGQYQFTLPADDTKRYLATDINPDERLDVGIVVSSTWKDGAWVPKSSSDSVGFRVAIKAPDGTTCGSQSASQSGTYSAPGLLRMTISVDPDGNRGDDSTLDQCKNIRHLTFEIQRDDSGASAGDLKAQLSMVKTPKAKNSLTAQDYSSLAPLDTSPLQASSSASPGAGFSDAKILAPGGYTVPGNPGRRSFYRVHLSYGQRLSVSWQLPKNGTAYKPGKDLDSELKVYSPTFVPVGDFGDDNSSTGRLSASSTSTEPDLLKAHTSPVDYANIDAADSSSSNKQLYTANPGWYYIALDTVPSDLSGGLDAKDFDTVLSIRVDGSPKNVPEFAVAQPAAGNLSGEATQAGTPVYVWLPVALVGLGGIGVLAYVMYRRSTAEASPVTKND